MIYIFPLHYHGSTSGKKSHSDADIKHMVNGESSDVGYFTDIVAWQEGILDLNHGLKIEAHALALILITFLRHMSRCFSSERGTVSALVSQLPTIGKDNWCSGRSRCIVRTQ
jgi:hypothetical protein